jgi:hypothetical protein
MDDIIEDVDGSFYHWDGNGSLVGPFKTHEQCDAALQAALRWEAKDHQPQIRKMRDTMGS